MTDINRLDAIEVCGSSTLYSNLDHVLERRIAKGLEFCPNLLRAEHVAWTFCGYVWFDGRYWHEQVWRSNAPVEEITNINLRDLIQEVNDKYGRE